MIIIGIDPGSRATGYGIVDTSGSDDEVIEFGVIRLDAETSHPMRLRTIYRSVVALIEEHVPDELAIEMPVYGRNPQSMLKLGRAQAAAMLAGLNRDLPVAQYTPKEVKKSVTGNGNASKRQIRFMVHSILKLDGPADTITLDASDALAIALCHGHREAHEDSQNYSGWSSFVDSNPDRVSE
jgi:crossover junction endodeoxyribonuclease RuvC